MTSYSYTRPEDIDKEEEKEVQTIEEDDDGVYTEEDIKKAFHCFDLDKNGYIGASELRHLLIFMGEHVTFEEVDMMINMLDVNVSSECFLVCRSNFLNSLHILLCRSIRAMAK